MGSIDFELLNARINRWQTAGQAFDSPTCPSVPLLYSNGIARLRPFYSLAYLFHCVNLIKKAVETFEAFPVDYLDKRVN
jgi:hypothetical protein